MSHLIGPLSASVVDGQALLDTAIASLVAAVVVTLAACASIYGFAMAAEMRREDRGAAALAAGALGVVASLAFAAVIVLVGVAADVLFAAQTRTEVVATLTARAAQADQLVAQGTDPRDVVRRVRVGGGVGVVLRAADGRVLAAAGDQDPGARTVVRRLPDGSVITLAPDPSVLGAACLAALLDV